MFATTVAEQAANVNLNLPAVSSYLNKINWSTPTWDLFIFVFFVGAAFLYTISLGRTKIVASLVSLYVSLAVVTNLPYLIRFTEGTLAAQFFAFKTIIFIAVFIILFAILSRSTFLEGVVSGSPGSLWGAAILSVLHVGLFISIILSFLPIEALGRLAPITRTVFAGHLGRSFWLIVPLLGMIIGHRRE